EYEVTPGLGWIAGEVERIAPSDPSLKIPHMGWNTLNACRPHPLFEGIAVGPQGLHAYFVHSFHLKAAARSDLIAEADYGGPLTAVVGLDTMVGTQFHPEKSQRLGLRRIAPFLEWKPWCAPNAPRIRRRRMTSSEYRRDPLSRHRPQGRRMRAARARRHDARDGVSPRSGGAGASLRGAGV